MPVQFKFRGEKAFRSLLNVTTPCTLQRVKTAIYEQARISDAETDLHLDNNATGTTLDPKVLLIEDSLVQVLVRRTPKAEGQLGGSLAVDDFGGDAGGFGVDDDDLAMDRVMQAHDISSLGLSSASSGPTQRFNRSYNAAASGGRQQFGYDGIGDEDQAAVEETKEPPPENYTCHRCGSMGSHWIWDCPTNDDPEHMKKVRTAKGIPRQFLKKVTMEEAEEKSAGGVVLQVYGHSGHYIYDHEASQEEKKRILGDTVQEKVTTAFSQGARRVEESLKCPLCHQMFRQAVLAPCCGATFCSDCAIDRLAHSSLENSCCPGCGAEVLVHQLIANEDVRRQVDQVSKASKATALASQKEPQKPQSGYSLTAALKDRVNRPRKHAEEMAAAASAGGAAQPVLALTDGSPAASGSNLPPPPANWQPLAFGPMLSAEQLSRWQQQMRSTSWSSAAVKVQFEDWQQSVRAAAAPPVVMHMPPAHGAFPHAHGAFPLPAHGAFPPPGIYPGAYPEDLLERERKHARHERRERWDHAAFGYPM
eukprot:TRINITY_DN36761_c0_g2_i1.p1 TRINITY_DN36761_c0_g2~~TRINITY_DN36761_c0_g2_i1.p1  ORF type:complete len:542 (+),score=131.14 TRINITY_DN36761_c0_g2_i1:27-1628(+)